MRGAYAHAPAKLGPTILQLHSTELEPAVHIKQAAQPAPINGAEPAAFHHDVHASGHNKRVSPKLRFFRQHDLQRLPGLGAVEQAAQPLKA